MKLGMNIVLLEETVSFKVFNGVINSTNMATVWDLGVRKYQNYTI
jgi:hypothetical protein